MYVWLGVSMVGNGKFSVRESVSGGVVASARYEAPRDLAIWTQGGDAYENEELVVNTYLDRVRACKLGPPEGWPPPAYPGAGDLVVYCLGAPVLKSSNVHVMVAD